MKRTLVVMLALACVLPAHAAKKAYTYTRIGSAIDVATNVSPGYRPDGRQHGRGRSLPVDVHALRQWRLPGDPGRGGTDYAVSAEAGVLSSTQPGCSAY